MSVRASLISFFLRRTVKKTMSNFVDPISVRARFSSSPKKLSAEVMSERVESGGVSGSWLWKKNADTSKIVLYLHGGGYVFGGYGSHGEIASEMADLVGGRALLLEYRLAPEHPFPAAFEDALSSYQWLLDKGYEPEDIFLAGDSAGGGLAVSLLLALKKNGLPLPKAVCLFSPWVDLTCAAASIDSNALSDCMLSPGALERFRKHYLGDADPFDERASPIFGDLSGLPPTYVAVGDEEILLDDSKELVNKIRSFGGIAELSIWHKMPHVFPILSSVIPEGRLALKEFASFKDAHA